MRLDSGTSDPETIFKYLQILMKEMHVLGAEYRAVSVNCSKLSDQPVQADLFGDCDKKEKKNDLFSAMDTIEKRFGLSSIGFAGSMMARDQSDNLARKRISGDIYPHELLSGETSKRRLRYPFLGSVT